MEVLKKNPNDEAALFGMGEWCAKEGKTRDAKNYFERVSNMESKFSTNACIRLMKLCAESGDTAEALEIAKKLKGKIESDDINRYIKLLEKEL